MLLHMLSTLRIRVRRMFRGLRAGLDGLVIDNLKEVVTDVTSTV